MTGFEPPISAVGMLNLHTCATNARQAQERLIKQRLGLVFNVLIRSKWLAIKP